jgi:hypothetical protein
MYTGACLCGGIRYEISGAITNIVCCHCSECRKAQGSAFATNGVVAANEFTLTAGEQLLTRYEPSPGYAKYFCSLCGSPIISKSEQKPSVVRVRIGTIESDIAERPMAHIFVGSKANWEEVNDALPQFEREQNL